MNPLLDENIPLEPIYTELSIKYAHSLLSANFTGWTILFFGFIYQDRNRFLMAVIQNKLSIKLCFWGKTYKEYDLNILSKTTTNKLSGASKYYALANSPENKATILKLPQGYMKYLTDNGTDLAKLTLLSFGRFIASHRHKLSSKKHVHHLDINPLNNCIDNLLVLSDKQHHNYHTYLNTGQLEAATLQLKRVKNISVGKPITFKLKAPQIKAILTDYYVKGLSQKDIVSIKYDGQEFSSRTINSIICYYSLWSSLLNFA